MKKILVTLGPNSISKDIISQMDKEKVHLFRINMSHTSIDKLENIIATIQQATSTPICIDSEGAQLRNQYMSNETLHLKKDDKVKIHFSEIIGDCNNISYNHVQGVKQLSIGDELMMDFNGVKLSIIEVHKDYMKAEVMREGIVGSNKAVSVSKTIELPSITKKDEAAIKIGNKMGVNHYALSFSGSARDVKKMRVLAGDQAIILAKIESIKGLTNLVEIINESDEILIDRGDLSREVPIEKVPFLQRNVIAHANELSKQVYVATNFLETMIHFNEPNRSEVNDIISTLQMGADGLVLAGETAVGKFPVECVQMVRRLILQYSKWSPNSNIDNILNL